MNSSGLPPAGWHPDPGDPSGVTMRWWDGTQWTPQTRPSEHSAPAWPSPSPSASSQRTGYPSPPSESAGYPAPPTVPPESAQPGYGQPGYAPPGYGAPGYGAPGYGQGPYGQGPYGQGPYGHSGSGQGPRPYGGRFSRGGFGMGGPTASTFGRRNQASLTAIVLGGIYLALAITAHFFIIGFVPALMAFRAFQRRESLAPVAAIVAVAVIALAVAYR